MTMHLHHPSLSLNGKKKGKAKFRNADAARKSRELEDSWKELQKKWGIEAEDKKRRRALEAPTLKARPKVFVRDTGPKIPSLNGGVDMSPAVLKPAPVYTGDSIVGISTLHKSNAVPVFSKEDAIEISRMRR